MFCSNCGTNNNEGAKFCSGCGAPMGVNNAAPVEPTPVAPVYAPVEPQTPVYAPVEPVAPAPAPQKPKKNNTGLIVGIIVGVLVVIGAVIAVLFATGTFDTDSKKEETTTEETDKKQNKDEDKEENKEENKEETPKGDENHDGRLIGTWTGYEKTQMEGYEVELKITYTFKEDGTYEMTYDYDQYVQIMKDIMIQMLADEYGYSEAEGDAMFEEAYGMDIDEYATYLAEEIKKEQEKATVSWETDGSQLKSSSKSGDTNIEVSSALNYSFSSDGNTLYLTGEMYGGTINGEYNRVK